MKFIRPCLALLLSAACLLTGCQSPQAKPPAGGGAAQETRNNGYSLLHQLLEEQKDVSMLRFIKREHSDVRTLVKKIAAASGAGAELLEDFARHDPSVILDDIQLPPGEIAARAAIAATKKKEILAQSGDTFELTLLLTQTEALSYAWHLAKVTGENERQPERVRALAGVQQDMKNLYQEVFVLLLSKTEVTATRQIKTQKQ
jgi:CheY-like chemotaxis protein